MSRVLADFRIESEKVILLSFLDGARYRVSATDLPRYLSEGDLDKINRALKLRQRFIKRVLPPTAMIVMLGVTFTLGYYDYHSISQKISPQGSVVQGEPKQSAEQIDYQPVSKVLTAQTSAKVPTEAPTQLMTTPMPIPNTIKDSTKTLVRPPVTGPTRPTMDPALSKLRQPEAVLPLKKVQVPNLKLPIDQTSPLTRK